ncbi:MAG: helix-turn-helix transcriptional regulator [Eubacteriales bacterium]|jgi:DNA-binding XRE family transcriptional regulator|nr:helix-turn-helix transcriptional regulator [Eubacteriales bacterium]
MKLKIYKKRSLKPILKLKGLRAERAVTQSDIANILGISTATYNRKENGLGQFDMREINIMTKFFGVTYEEIFDMGEVSQVL